MTKRVRVWIAACEGCQSRKPARFSKRSPLQSLVPKGPWNRIAMDLMGPLQETVRGNMHVLVVADPFTKWVEAFPVPNMGSETVAQIMVREVI